MNYTKLILYNCKKQGAAICFSAEIRFYLFLSVQALYVLRLPYLNLFNTFNPEIKRK